MAVLVNRKVKVELDEIWSYIATESDSTDVADRIIEAITDTFPQLGKHPQRGRPRDDLWLGLRSITAGSYIVIYRVEKSNVRILHVVHGRRDIRAVIRQ